MQKWKENKQKYNAEYNKANTKGVMLRLNVKTDADIIAKLESFDNKTGYIKWLIRKDMNK